MTFTLLCAGDNKQISHHGKTRNQTMKTKLEKLTIKRLRAIKKQILKEPRQFAMRWLFAKELRRLGRVEWTDNVHHNKPIPNCGTAACLAGWAFTLFAERGLNPREANELMEDNAYGIEDAREILRLADEQGKLLFHFENWPPKFRRAKEEGTPAFARQAAARIEHFIATSGAE